MISIALLLLTMPALAQAPQTPRSVITCGVRDAQTTSLRSSADYTATLQMHSEDDHGKNTHLCQAEYVLQIIQPDGTHSRIDNLAYPSGFFSSDDEWDRPLVFRVEGFSRDGTHVFVFISEGGSDGFIDAEEFDLKTRRRVKEEGADRFFLHRLGDSCAASLGISGTSADGHIILQTRQIDGCPRAESWELGPDRHVQRAGIQGTIPDVPPRLASGTKIAALDRGRPVQSQTPKD